MFRPDLQLLYYFLVVWWYWLYFLFFLFVIGSVSYLGKGAQDFFFRFSFPFFFSYSFRIRFRNFSFPRFVSQPQTLLLNGNLSSLSPIVYSFSRSVHVFPSLRLNAPLFNFFCLSTRTFGHRRPTISLAPFSFFLASLSLWSFFRFPSLSCSSIPPLPSLYSLDIIQSIHTIIPLNRRPWFVFVNDPAIFSPSVILYANQRWRIFM